LRTASEAVLTAKSFGCNDPFDTFSTVVGLIQQERLEPALLGGACALYEILAAFRSGIGSGIRVLSGHVDELPRGTTYQELGPDFLDRLEPERLTRQLVKRLEALGHKVTLEACPAA
jgi:hypothetical protein